MNDFKRQCGHPGWGGGCDTCWSESFIRHVAEGRAHVIRIGGLLQRLIDAGVDPDAVAFIRDGWDDDLFGMLDYGLRDEQVRAINAAWDRYKGGAA